MRRPTKTKSRLGGLVFSHFLKTLSSCGLGITFDTILGEHAQLPLKDNVGTPLRRDFRVANPRVALSPKTSGGRRPRGLKTGRVPKKN